MSQPSRVRGLFLLQFPERHGLCVNATAIPPKSGGTPLPLRDRLGCRLAIGRVGEDGFPVTIPLSIRHEATPAECGFATDADVQEIAGWPRLVTSADPMAVQDAAEYGGLAASKREFFRSAGRLALTLGELQSMIRSDPVAEIAALLVIRAKGVATGEQLGCALIRRTWSHNLVIDFLANHPELLRAPGTVRGVATGLLYFVLTLGEALGTGDFWGEATDQSAAFYRRQFRAMEITDRFVLPPAEQWHFLEKTRTKWKESGLALNLRLD